MIQYNTTINGIQVQAQYTEKSVEEIFIPLLRRLSAMRQEKGRRILVMLAAPPGAGKSTLMEFLKMLGEKEGIPVTVIGMDGFHRYQDDLLSHRIMRDGRDAPHIKIIF